MTKPTPIILDTFTDADSASLTSHTGDSGNTWSASNSNTGTAFSISGNSVNVTNLSGGYTTAGTATDLTVMLDNSPQASNPIGSGPALNASANMPGGSYVGLCYSGHWYIFKGSASNFQSLGSASVGSEFPAAGTAADPYTVRLIRRSASGTATINLIVNGRKVVTATDSSPLTGPPGIYSNNTGTGTIDNFRVFAASSEIGVAMIGDSITAGLTTIAPGYLTTPPDVFFGAQLSRGKTGLPVVIYNHGVTATTSSDWAHGTNGASLSSVITDLQNQSTRCASLMLGVNDSGPAHRISIATHKANIASICGTLNAAGISVMLNRPTYLVPGALGGGVDAASSATYLPGYWEAQQALVNGFSIFQGDTQGFDMIAADPSNRTGDGVHPVQSFSRILFQLHAGALLSVFNPSAGARGRSNVNQNVDGGLT